MKLAAGASLLVLLIVAGCRSSSGNAAADNAEKIFKAPENAPAPAVDSETQAPIAGDKSEIKAPRPEVLETVGMQVKEIVVDPKDARTRIDLARTLLGEDWMFMSRTAKSDGVVVWKFMRRDVARIDVDPFGIPDIHKSTQEPQKPVK